MNKYSKYITFGLLNLIILSSYANGESITQQTPVCSQVTLKWAKLINIAEVTFSATDCSSYDSAHKSGNKSLKFSFKRQVSASFFEQAANKGFKANLIQSAVTKDHILMLSMAFNKKYQDMEAGDEYLIQQDKVSGITLFKNNLPIAKQPNQLFAKHYLNIWLGQEPAIKSLKNLLLESFN